MRRRLVLILAALSVAAACAAPTTAPGPAPASAGGAAPETRILSAMQPRDDPTAPPSGPRLPEPIPVPADSYAPEAVVRLGTIEIPSIGLHDRLYQGVTLHNIDLGPSHWTGSAMPGEMGNAVIAGHRSTVTEPFRRIADLVAGDAVILTANGARWTYRVTGHLVVRPEDSWIADQTTAFTATLYACHPVGSQAERYVVRLVLEA
ncbi:MAG: sortase [Acidimicrobiales bacterium]